MRWEAPWYHGLNNFHRGIFMFWVCFFTVYIMLFLLYSVGSFSRRATELELDLPDDFSVLVWFFFFTKLVLVLVSFLIVLLKLLDACLLELWSRLINFLANLTRVSLSCRAKSCLMPVSHDPSTFLVLHGFLGGRVKIWAIYLFWSFQLVSGLTRGLARSVWKLPETLRVFPASLVSWFWREQVERVLINL